MGRFLIAGNEAFAEFSRTRYFVDKSELINKLLEKDITEKFVCNSRARRFGKSVTADMQQDGESFCRHFRRVGLSGQGAGRGEPGAGALC